MIAIAKPSGEWNIVITKENDRYSYQPCYGIKGRRTLTSYCSIKGIDIVAEICDLSDLEMDLLIGQEVHISHNEIGEMLYDVRKIGPDHVKELVDDMNNPYIKIDPQEGLDRLYDSIYDRGFMFGTQALKTR